MRGADIRQNALFVTVTVEDFVPLDHPLRTLRDLINEALKDLDGLFGSIYADAGRESIPPERLVRALLLQVLYTICSEHQLMEQVRYKPAVPLVRGPDHRRGGLEPFHLQSEERKNDTHHSVTDPDARLYRKSAGTGAILYYQGHGVMENRNGLVVKANVSHASGTAERDTALELLKALLGKRRKTAGGDKGYDVKSFVQGCREARITAHVAAKKKGSAIDQRTQHHAGYAVSQRIRKRIEEVFGWNKSIGTLRQVKQRGLAHVDALFQFGMLSWNLVRMRNILAMNAATG